MATKFSGNQLMTTEYNCDLDDSGNETRVMTVVSPFLSPFNEACCSPRFQCSLKSFCQSILLDTT